MSLPRVSIIWLNYNSMSILSLVRESLEALSRLDYPDYEVIVVDNGSSDGSFEAIKDIVGRLKVRVKLVRLERNLGFTGGNNAGYRARDPDSKYVALVNNDAVVEPDSLRSLVECAESFDGVGAVQGVILDYETGRVDSAGGMLTELLISVPLYYQKAPESLRKPIYVTYPEGAYSLLNVKALRKATGWVDKLFYDEAFAYLDDSLLGLQLWNAGYGVVSCPFISANHKRSSTLGALKPFQAYLSVRGRIAMVEASNSKYKPLIKASPTWSALLTALPGAPRLSTRRRWKYYNAQELYVAVRLGYRDGIRLGRMIAGERGGLLDLYKAPIIKVSKAKALLQLASGYGLYYLRRVNTALYKSYEPVAVEGALKQLKP